MMRYIAVPFALVAFASTAFAHLVVVPPQSVQGQTQAYKVRVHNEEKVATVKIELDVPKGLDVTKMADVPGARAGMNLDPKAGRADKLTWTLNLAPGKYIELPFTATNPSDATEIHWTVHQLLANDVRVDWSDKPGATGKGSVTKLVRGGQAK